MILSERNSPVPPTKTPPPGFGRLSLSDDENTENVKPKVNILVGPGGDNASELSGLGSGGGQSENQKPYKKKTRGTRGGRKNRLRKMKESEKLLKQSLVTAQRGYQHKSMDRSEEPQRIVQLCPKSRDGVDRLKRFKRSSM